MSDCPCCSGRDYVECCEPLIKGVVAAETAEQLLRSRYSAHSVGAIDYIVATNHEATRDSIDRETTKKWAAESDWLSFEIKSIEGGSTAENSGKIEFVASYRDGRGRAQTHHELALFEKEGESWFFKDAVAPRQEQVRHEGKKVGRNDPCPCESGKKHKKCCGKVV